MDLNPGEILCDGCEGVGKHSYKKSYGFTRYEIIECNICKGTGKLDWIETIVGKKEKYIVPEKFKDNQEELEEIKKLFNIYIVKYY